MDMHIPGSRWWKFDFHNHTPASSDYDTAESLTLRPRDWLLACMRKGVDCVAVTDHNCADWVDSLQAELVVMAQEMPPPDGFRELVLFPAAEISTADSLHVLAIFDPGTGKAKLDGLLHGKLVFSNGTKKNAEWLCQQSCMDVIRHIHDLGGLAIAAHVEQANGLLQGELSGTSFQPRLSGRSIEDVLGQVDALEVQNGNAAAIAHYSSRISRLAQVSGSDSHVSGNAGTRFSWVKMSVPNLEGLRLALMDPECSVRRSEQFNGDPQPVPARRIRSISMDKLALHRSTPPLSIAFSPWYTSVIGGRGSGKSTVVETLRLALGRDGELGELGEDSEVLKTFERFRQKYSTRDKPGMLLDDTCLTVELARDREGVTEEYRYTWRQSGLSVDQWDGQSWQPTGLNLAQARELFPVRMFSQKQIFNLAQRTQALLAYLDAAPEVGKAEWQSAFDAARRKFLQAREKVRELEKALLDRAPLETELKEVARKALVFSQAHFADKLRAYQREKQQQTRMQDFSDGLGREIASLKDYLAEQSGLTEWELAGWLADRADEQGVLQKADALRQLVKGQFDQLLAVATSMEAAVADFRQSAEIRAWQSASSNAMQDYEQVVAQMRAQGVEGPQQAAAALQRKEAIERQLAILVQKETELENARKVCARAYVAMSHERRNLTRRRQGFVDRVLREAGIGNLQIQLFAMEDMEGSKDALRSLLRLQGGTFEDEVWKEEGAAATGFLADLIKSERPRAMSRRLRQLKENLEDPVEQTLSLGLHGKLSKALAKLSSSDWDGVWNWFPDDLVVVRHQHGGSWKDLQQASAGQKTAAILSFLLAHGDEPLILDQPEDDLDNALVYELVVRQLRDNKARRQLIVVTHNANIVVNGDAELVQPMAVRGGQIVTDTAGGLQERAVRVRICDIMEGGRDAFKQRYKRILEDMERRP